MTRLVTYNAEYCPRRHRAARKAHVLALSDLVADRPVAAGVTEAGGYRRELRNVDGYQSIQPRGAAGRCALLIRADAKVHAHGSVKLHGRRFVGRDVPGARHTGWTKARYIVWALITDPDTGELVYVAVWHPVPGQSHSKRARALLGEEADKGGAWLKGLRHPGDLMGDTNGDPKLRLFDPLRAVASPAFAASHGKARIDGHWIKDGTADARALKGYPSDHKPVAADVTWKRRHPAHKGGTVSNYHRADRKAQWFEDKYPGAVMDPNCVVLHTTEGTTWPGYSGGAVAPNYTAKPSFAKERLNWRAHFPDERSARALENHAGGVETNTLNVVQVELVGTCDPAHRRTWGSRKAGVDYIYWPDAPDWALRDLGEFLADQHARHGTRLEAPCKFAAYPGSYGTRNGVRMTGREWLNFYGVCGHQHVPENVHGDPGALDIDAVLGFARGDDKPAAEPEPVRKVTRVTRARNRLTALIGLLSDAVETRPKAVNIKAALRKARQARKVLPRR